MTISRFYSTDACNESKRARLFKQLQSVSICIVAKASSKQIVTYNGRLQKSPNIPFQLCSNIKGLQIEKCYYVETNKSIQPNSKEESLICWLLKHPQSVNTLLYQTSFISENDNNITIIEIGPRFNFSTAFSTNCVNICQNVGLKDVKRVESSNRYCIEFENNINESKIVELLCDQMTECVYTKENTPIYSFDEGLENSNENWYQVPLLEEGKKALEGVNNKLGLGFDDWDQQYYTNLFKNVLRRNPTTVELFDCAQSNSEHSRHWFFRGKINIDGCEQPKSLIRMIMDTQVYSNANNTIKFSDNSSAIRGFQHKTMRPKIVDGPGPILLHKVESDLIFTAETHNMPTAVAPFSGATTGTGGRLRDVQGVGRGGLPIAGTAGYCVGCLNIPGYTQSYDNNNYKYPNSFAKPLRVLIEASNGASDYGNKFGEPVISGFVLSYGLTNASNKRDEYIKPIMFSGGVGIMDSTMRSKIEPRKGMLLAKIGGPVYRIGVGGGAASSIEVQGSSSANLDFNAVQRGDPEMENKLNRVVRACIEMGEKNPILAIHDQGAGGNGNVLKELVEPGLAGAVIFSKEFQLGDPTISTLELWGAEYQENNAILCKVEDRKCLESICARERCPISFVGVVTGNGRVSLIESSADFESSGENIDPSKLGPLPFDLDLRHVLGEMPKREYKLNRISEKLYPLKIDIINYSEYLEKVLSLVAVGSKRFLTNKVDRCVTGLIAQQQCVGPLHTPLCDYGLVAVSHFGNEGIATSIGTQPIKGLIDAKSMARMCVAEAVSNLVFVKITELADVKCSGNWMWAAKLPGEGAKLYDACKEMCQIMKELHIAVDGGKDSLSMAAKVDKESIISPGTLVISTYAPCEDINIKVTPDLKGPGLGFETALIWINIEGKFRLGASALAQTLMQKGNECPTVLRTDVLKNAFNVTQQLLQAGKILSGHDISDGGLIVCLLEMSVSGLSGLAIDLTAVMNKITSFYIDHAALSAQKPEIALLFAEECGWVLEVKLKSLAEVQTMFSKYGVPNYYIGNAVGYGLDANITISSNSTSFLKNNVKTIFKQWERTSFEIEKLQANVECAIEEFETLNYRTGPQYQFTVDLCSNILEIYDSKIVKVAVLREEGINSDREMIAALLKANFEVHDVTMSDLLTRKTSLEHYRGVIFPGGFSYADTLGSAKGWAANIMFSELLSAQFRAFQKRKDVFSLGVCNGCQLMHLLGWVGVTNRKSVNEIIEVPDVALLHNKSERFECRWVTVKIEPSNAVMLRRLEGSILGCWVAHGEGKFSFRTPETLKSITDKKCVAVRYVDDNGTPTEVYPMNPNGSVQGIAGICSEDGRHLALMPHPERCNSMFQWPYISPRCDKNSKISPWQIMFNDAYQWCIDQIN